MCGAILWVNKQDDSPIPQSIYLLHASMITTLKKKKWILQENCHTYALKLVWNAYIWHVLEDLIFYGQWTNLHDRLRNGPEPVTNAWIDWFHIFIIRVNTNKIVMLVILQNSADRDLFQESGFAGDLEDSKSISGGTLCVFGSHTFVPISWMCKKQTSVSHSSTESEIISLDAGLRLDGIPALDLWDLIVLVLGNTTQNLDRTGKPVVCRDKNHVHQQSPGMFNVLNNADFVLSHVQFSHHEALLYVIEDYEAVIKMIIKGRSPTMRHVSRTHRVALDWLFDRINFAPTNPNQLHGYQKPSRWHANLGKFHTWRMESSSQSFGQNWWWANGIRVEHLPRIHHIGTLHQSPIVIV